nr:thioredoxin domain-containing protein PLP3B-like isoform X2 [Nicotiana tomentosiformis]
MDPDSVKSTLSNLAFGNVMAAAARDYQKEVLAQEKAQASSSVNQDIDLDELMDDPELEKLHADRIAALKKEAEKRQALKTQGHGEYREISEGDFLGEVTGCEKVICHFYHREFYRCKIMDKHLKSLAPRHVDTKFLKLDAENAPFFVTKLGIKTLPCVIFFSCFQGKIKNFKIALSFKQRRMNLNSPNLLVSKSRSNLSKQAQCTKGSKISVCQ